MPFRVCITHKQDRTTLDHWSLYMSSSRWNEGAAVAAGALCRYHIGRLVQEHCRVNFPLAPLLINVSGSLLLGILAGLLARAPDLPVRDLGLLVGTAFCGAYTTFSTFALEAVDLVRRGHVSRAALNLLLVPVSAGWPRGLG